MDLASEPDSMLILMTTRDFADSLYSIWIIEKTSGICIFAQDFTELPVKINEDLAAGFFSAIHLFSKETTGQFIKYMELDEICFHFHIMDQVYFVLVTAKDADRDQVQAFFSSLQQRFETKFQDQLANGSFNDVSVFSSFAAEIEEELGKKATFHSLFEEPADIIKKRYENARKQMLLIRKTIFDTGVNIVKSMTQFDVIGHVLEKGLDHIDERKARKKARSRSKQDP